MNKEAGSGRNIYCKFHESFKSEQKSQGTLYNGKQRAHHAQLSQ